MKVRIEIGPGIPSDLGPIKSGDGNKALIRAIAELLTRDTIAADYVAEGTSGGVTVYAQPKRFDMGADRKLPSTIHTEVELTVRLEGA